MVSCGMRREASVIGESSRLRTVQPPHFLISASIIFALPIAMA